MSACSFLSKDNLFFERINAMKEENIKKLISNFEQMEALLKKYTETTSEILGTDSEDSDIITGKIEERAKLIAQIDVIKNECTQLIDSGEQQEAEQIREMLNGSNINRRISDSLVPLRNAIVNLRSTHLQAVEKDKALQTQFNSRTSEAKEELVKLKEDKKKLDYYSSANSAPADVGGALDSSF